VREFAERFVNATGGGGVFAGISLGLFALIFGVAVWRALRQPRRDVEQAARLPLEDD
jgi:hypothetical protein